MPKWTGFSAVQAGLGASLRQAQNARYVYTNFRGQPIFADVDGFAARGTGPITDAEVFHMMIDGHTFQIRTEQDVTADPPLITSNDGLLINVDDADNEGLEINLGRVQGDGSTLWTNSKGAFVSQTDEFFLRVKLDVADVSDADQLAIGFSLGNYPADGLFDTYTDFFVINIDNGDVKIETRLNSGTATSTDTTTNIADADQPELEIRVNSSGYARAFVNGAVPSTDKTDFQFDSGDVLHAFYTQLNDAAGDPTVSLIEWESGLWSSRGLGAIDDSDTAGAVLK